MTNNRVALRRAPVSGRVATARKASSHVVPTRTNNASGRSTASRSGSGFDRKNSAPSPTASAQLGNAASRSASARTNNTKAQTTSGPTKPTVQGFVGWAANHRLFVGIVGSLLLLILVFYSPLSAYYAAARTNAILSEQLAEVTSDNEILTNDVSNLLTKEGIEDEARRRGYVGEDETAVDMQGIEDSGSAASDSTITEEAKAEEAPWYQTVLDFVFQYKPETQGIN